MTPDVSNTVFQQAIAFVNQTQQHLFVTGKAGTGKTTFLKYIRDHTHKKMAVVAPTGVAAINAGGMTIHSFFQLPFGMFLPSDGGLWGSVGAEMNNRSTLIKNLKLNAAKRNIIRELDLLVIDEVSMVRADLLDAIDTVMRHVRRQPLQPFGGAQMLYIGDLFQLPPVVRNEEWPTLESYYKTPFFFSAQALQYSPPLYLELTKIYRQKDDHFISILNNIRNNCCTPDDLDALHHYYDPTFEAAKDEGYITLTTHNSKAEIINQTELKNLSGKIYTYQAAVTGEFVERSYPADKELKLKVGARVMFIKNDKGEARRYYNGKIGTIKKLETEKIIVEFNNGSDDLELEQEKWDNIRYNYDNDKDHIAEETLGTFTQYPLRLAWAITIHKSQGLTFQKAIVDAGASFAAGQVYVSLSRLTSLQGLVLRSQIPPHSISTDQRVVDYVQQAHNEQGLQDLLEAAQKVYVRQLLVKSFEWQKLQEAIAINLENYEHRVFPEKEAAWLWGKELANASGGLMGVAEKFTKQLEFLLQTCETDQYNTLYERTAAACKYFDDEMKSRLLQPLHKHIAEVKVKQKTKRYVKELQELELLCKRKQTQLQQALALAKGLYESAGIQQLLQMVEPPVVSVPKEESSQKKGKMAKGESGKMSLEMFKQGKAIPDIAKERGLAESTVEGHLADMVATGDVDVLDLMDQATLEKVLQIMTAQPDLPHGEVRQQAGNVSYGVIKAVAGYVMLMKRGKEE